MKIRVRKIHLKLFGILSILTIIFLIFGISNKIGFAQKAKLNSESIVKINSNYFEYSESALINAKKNGKVLLFFAATSWCSTCSDLEQEIIEKNKKLPKNLTILKIDYDKDKQTNKKYFVINQHTLILLDREGAEITRWIGGDFKTLLSKVNES